MTCLRHERKILENDAAADPTASAADSAAVQSTWAKRQPTMLIQPIRQRHHRQKTHAERQTDKMRYEHAKENNEPLQAEVKAFHNLRDKMVKELVGRFRKKEEYIRGLLFSSSTLKSTRKPNLKNAIIHQKVKELNEGSWSSRQIVIPVLLICMQAGKRAAD